VVSALSASCHLVGYLHDASILPVVGNDAFAKPGHECGELNTSAEGKGFFTVFRPKALHKDMHSVFFLIYS
jgi:hypothetical protein